MSLSQMCLSLTVHAKVHPLCVLGFQISKSVCAFHTTPAQNQNALKANTALTRQFSSNFSHLFIYCKATISHSNLAVHFIESTVHPRLNKSCPRRLCHFQEHTEVTPPPPWPAALCSDQKHQKHFQNYFHSAHVIPTQLFCICCLCSFTLREHNNNSGQ